MIIDNSYFQGNLKVPNSQDALTPLSDRRGNTVNLEEYIARYEREVMIFALGLTLYNDFKTSFESNGSLIPTPQPRWKSFIDGEEYQVDGDDFEWKGLRFKEGGLNYSLIANYVYSKFLPEVSSTFGSAGIQKNNAKASRGYSSIPKTIESWNEFISMYQGDNAESYGDPRVKYISRPGLIGIDYSSQRRSDYVVNMYQYLQDKISDYTGVNTFLFEVENSFGL